MICVNFILSNIWCIINQGETEMKNEFKITLYIKKLNINYNKKKRNIYNLKKLLKNYWFFNIIL